MENSKKRLDVNRIYYCYIAIFMLINFFIILKIQSGYHSKDIFEFLIFDMVSGVTALVACFCTQIYSRSTNNLFYQNMSFLFLFDGIVLIVTSVAIRIIYSINDIHSQLLISNIFHNIMFFSRLFILKDIYTCYILNKEFKFTFKVLFKRNILRVLISSVALAFVLYVLAMDHYYSSIITSLQLLLDLLITYSSIIGITNDKKKTFFNTIILCLSFMVISDLYAVFGMNKNNYLEPLSQAIKIIGYFFPFVGMSLEFGDTVIEQRKTIDQLNTLQKEIIKSESKYQLFFNSCADYVYLSDILSNEIVEANNNMLKALGAPLDEVNGLGKNNYYKIIMDKKESDMIDEAIAQGESVHGSQMTILNHRGEIYHLEINYTPIIENGKVSKVFAIGRDMSSTNKIRELQIEKKQQERMLLEVKEYDRIKSEFFANINHELRTPINIVYSALQVMELDEKFKKNKYIKVIKQNAFRLMRLVNNLLDLTKMDAGYYKIEPINCDIVSVVEDITDSVIPYAKNKKIELIFDTDTEEKIMAVDPDKIERIVINLLSNAIKFTNYGGNILVYLKDLGKAVQIRVKDDGMGIPEEKIQSVFERFVQADKSLNRKHEGTGIGLALVKSLAELHGGRCMLNSKPGEGSEFIVELPVKILDDIDNIPSADEEETSKHIQRINIEFSDIYDLPFGQEQNKN